MKKLFTPKKIGKVKIKNRFIHSATYECMAEDNGEVTNELIQRYKKIAQGGVGLIIPGYMYVDKSGRAFKNQIGVYSDDKIKGLKKISDTVHDNGGKVFFQLAHAGRQTTRNGIGQTPISPSSRGRDPMYFIKPKKMDENEINEVIEAFGKASKRAEEAGADGIQIHCAHGYLINQFLSPFFNIRKDSWGGTDEKRFRFLKEIIKKTRENISKNMPVIVKLNSNDFTPKAGVTPQLAAKYSKWLSEFGIDGIEISCGTAFYSYMNMCRGRVPVDEFVKGLPWWKKSAGRFMMKALVGRYDLEEGYNLAAAREIKPVIGDVPLMVVGGMRTLDRMGDVIKKGETDFISMSRPFIREPNLVNKFKEGKLEAVSCVSCNNCLAAAAGNIPVRCYNKKFPE